jgi:hypothetical protein
MIYRTLLLASLVTGSLQAQMRREFAGKNFAVRNLGYSGDRPLGVSRASFDSAAKGVDNLKDQLAVVKPTVAVIGSVDGTAPHISAHCNDVTFLGVK